MAKSMKREAIVSYARSLVINDKDKKGRVPNPNTFSGGYQTFCERKSDRLSFRSLWPPRPSMVERCGAWLNDRIAALLRWMGTRRGSG